MKKFLLLGNQRSGQAAAQLCQAYKLPYLLTTDQTAGDLDTAFAEVGTLIVSPGVRATSPILQKAQALNLPIWSEMELGFRYWSGPILGITGTNGKTTTTELTSAILTAAQLPNVTAGNIGTPLSLLAARQATGELPKNMIAVTEVSSFQLEYIQQFSPYATVLLNVASDHLDRYGDSLNAYREVKERIFRHTPVNHRFFGLSMPDFEGDFWFDSTSVTFKGRPVLNWQNCQLKGAHNLENLLAAWQLASTLIPEKKLFTHAIINAICQFRPGQHRMELVAEAGGIKFVNDSKATNPASVVAAVHALEPGTAVRIILGGLDKDMDFTELQPVFPSFAKVYLIGQCADTIDAVLPPNLPRQNFGNDFDRCVLTACTEARPGEIVLLSPACASMDMFKDYEERGDKFSAICRNFLDSKH